MFQKKSDKNYTINFTLSFNPMTLLILGVFFFMGLGFIVFAWTEPGSTPPNGNVGAPINIGASSQEKIGPLTVDTTTMIGGTLYMATNTLYGDNIERINQLIGFNGISLKGNSSDAATTTISGSQLSLSTAGSEKWRVGNDGTLTRTGAGNYTITGLQAPVLDSDAATRYWVLQQVGAGGTSYIVTEKANSQNSHCSYPSSYPQPSCPTNWSEEGTNDWHYELTTAGGGGSGWIYSCYMFTVCKHN